VTITPEQHAAIKVYARRVAAELPAPTPEQAARLRALLNGPTSLRKLTEQETSVESKAADIF